MQHVFISNWLIHVLHKNVGSRCLSLVRMHHPPCYSLKYQGNTLYPPYLLFLKYKFLLSSPHLMVHLQNACYFYTHNRYDIPLPRSKHPFLNCVYFCTLFMKGSILIFYFIRWIRDITATLNCTVSICSSTYRLSAKQPSKIPLIK